MSGYINGRRRRCTGGRIRARGIAILALAAAAGLAVPAGPAVAAVDPSAYQGVYADFAAANARVGGYLACPAGRKAVAGGAYLSSADGGLTSLAPTEDGGGWYAAARLNSSTGAELTAFGMCVPAAQVAAASTIVVRDHRDRVDFHGQRSCPAGYLALAGVGSCTDPARDRTPATRPAAMGCSPAPRRMAPAGSTPCRTLGRTATATTRSSCAACPPPNCRARLGSPRSPQSRRGGPAAWSRST